jgi:hypothetical protein
MLFNFCAPYGQITTVLLEHSQCLLVMFEFVIFHKREFNAYSHNVTLPVTIECNV